MDNTADYDYYEGAIELTDINNYCSANAQFTTIGATPDMNAASCWNTNPNYNRWFKFQASATEKITLSVTAWWIIRNNPQIQCGHYGNQME